MFDFVHISAVISSSSLLYKEGITERLRSSSYVSKWDLNITLEARSCIRSNFRFSDDLQKCQVRWR